MRLKFGDVLVQDWQRYSYSGTGFTWLKYRTYALFLCRETKGGHYGYALCLWEGKNSPKRGTAIFTLKPSDWRTPNADEWPPVERPENRETE